MAIPITIPRLGWNMEQGVFAGWLKSDGATIRAGETIFTLEGEKATEDIECLDSGVLHIPPSGPKSGETLPVGAIIGYLLQPGEAIPAPATIIKSPEQSVTKTAEQTPNRSVTLPRREGPASSPRARRAATRLGIDWTQAKGTGRSGRIRERDVLALGESGKGTGGTRRVIAERMLASQRTTAPVTLTTTVDATELVQLRKRWQAKAGGMVPSYTDLFVKLAALALQKHPSLNARWENDRVVVNEQIHIGIAVDTEAGLLVPVVRDTARLSLEELAKCSRDLVERARTGKLSASELRGGTFTVTSLGAYGIDAFTPIINVPECAILGIGRIRRCPAVVGDDIVIRDQVTLSLTFDHRVVDGAPAARFLQTFGEGMSPGNASLILALGGGDNP